MLIRAFVACWLFYQICEIICVKVFKNRPSKICGRQPLKNFTLPILEYLDPYISQKISFLPHPSLCWNILKPTFSHCLRNASLITDLMDINQREFIFPRFTCLITLLYITKIRYNELPPLQTIFSPPSCKKSLDLTNFYKTKIKAKWKSQFDFLFLPYFSNFKVC